LVHRGYLGIQFEDLKPEVASRLGLENAHGVVVAQVIENSPAANADIKEGDVIMSIGGKPVSNGNELKRAVISLPLNQPEPIRIYRDGKELDTQVTILEQPADYGVANAPTRRRAVPGDEGQSVLDKLGMDVKDLTPALAERAGFKEDAKGALITHVDENSIASEQGLEPRMLIIKVDKKPVTSAAQLETTLAKASLESGVLIQLQLPDGRTAYRVLKSGSVK
jgi:serine protease Do